MKQKEHYSETLAYLRDYCLRHGRPMHFSAGDIFETEGAAARLFGYIESGSFRYSTSGFHIQPLWQKGDRGMRSFVSFQKSFVLTSPFSLLFRYIYERAQKRTIKTLYNRENVESMKFGETLVVLGIFVVLPTIIVWLVSRYKKHEIDKRAEMALAAIEKDYDMDLEAFFWKMNLPSRTIKEKLLGKLLWGCIFTIFGACIYIALAVYGIVIDRVMADMFIGLSMVAVPSLGIGIAFLINYFVGKKALKQEMEAQLKSMQSKE